MSVIVDFSCLMMVAHVAPFPLNPRTIHGYMIIPISKGLAMNTLLIGMNYNSNWVR